MASKSSLKIRCGQCNLPFWSEEQLKKHAVTHRRRKMFNCTYCKKGFVRGDHLNMHECTCEKNLKMQIKGQKYSTIMQIRGGVNNVFIHLESAFGHLFQTLFLQATENNSKPGKVQTTILLTCIGSKGGDIYSTFTFKPEANKHVLGRVIKKFETYCQQKKNFTPLRNQFFTCRQMWFNIFFLYK